LKWNNCKVEGCTNLATDEYCHYHLSLIDRPCAYYTHKQLSVGVEWCYKLDKRYMYCDCDNCEEWKDPVNNIELIKRRI